jgi:hypothetical protein
VGMTGTGAVAWGVVGMREVQIKWAAGALSLDSEGRRVAVVTVDVADDQVQTVRAISNPGKLRHIAHVRRISRAIAEPKLRPIRDPAVSQESCGLVLLREDEERRKDMPRIGRFLIGSTLLMVGCMVGLSAAITVVGLPIGLIIVGVGLQLMFAPSGGRSRQT